jgi:putative flippase GtrA
MPPVGRAADSRMPRLMSALLSTPVMTSAYRIRHRFTKFMRQPVRYGLVGLISTAINYTSFVAAIALGMHYLIAATVSNGLTLLAGYILNRTFTFAAPGQPNIREFTSFMGVFAIQYVLGISNYAVLIGHLGWNPSLAFVLNSAVMAVATYCLLRYGTFRAARRT